MAAIIPGMLLVGTAKSSLALYGGLALYAYGRHKTLSLLQSVWKDRRGRQSQRREGSKIFLPNPRLSLSISLLYLPCMFLFIAEIPLTPASPPELNDGRYFLKYRPRFEDSVEMDQLKPSHLRAGRHRCQLYFTYSRALFVSYCFADVPVAVLGCFAQLWIMKLHPDSHAVLVEVLMLCHSLLFRCSHSCTLSDNSRIPSW